MKFLQRTIEEVITEEAKDQSAILAENYLNLYEMSCVQRSFCEVGTNSVFRDGLAENSLRAAQQSMT